MRSIFPSLKHRSREVEEMDDLNMGGKDLEKVLRDLARVHKMLGGKYAVIKGVNTVVRPMDPAKNKLKLLDAGCGGGDSLRDIDKWMRTKKLSIDLTGVDANDQIIQYCKQRQNATSNISYQRADLFDPDFNWGNYDIVLFSLILHHFSDDDIKALIERCRGAGVKYIIINDLHRSLSAYLLFQIFTRIIPFSQIARSDGLLSIKKGFRKNELTRILERTGVQIEIASWQWAFRYLLVGKC